MKAVHRSLFFAALLLALLLSAAVAEDAAGESVIFRDLSIGYEGLITYSRPMPLRLTVENNGPDRSGVLAVNVYVSRDQYDRYELPMNLASGARRQAVLPIRSYFKQASYTVEWVEGGRQVCASSVSPARVVDPSCLLVGVLTEDPISLYYMNITKDNDALHRGELWRTVTLDEATLPDSDQLLSSFDILVVDQFDATRLSRAQTDAVGRWLQAGGVLVLGGGADAASIYPVFQEWTGVLPGKVGYKADVTPALAAYLHVNEPPAGENVLLTQPQGGTPIVWSEGVPVLMREKAGSGVVYTAAFSWGDTALDTWQLKHTLLQRLLIQDAPRVYQNKLNDQARSDDVYWDAESFARASKVPNTSSALPMLLVLGAYLALGGVGGYLLLKKWDKRELIWGFFPVLTGLCVAAIALMGQAANFAAPMAATMTHYDLDDGAAPSTFAVVTVNDGKEHTLSVAGQDVRLLATNAYYFYDDIDGAVKAEPNLLRFRYLLGREEAVGVSFGAPWSLQSLRIPLREKKQMDVRAQIHPISQGLAGTVYNGSEYALRGGVVFTSFGFCTVPDLAPGESAEFSLVEKADNKKNLFLNGVYVRNNPDSSYYSQIYAYLYPEEQQGKEANISQEEREARDATYTLLSNVFSGSYQIYGDYSTFFRFVAFNDELNPAELQVDGKRIDRVVHRGIVSLSVDYQARGDNGSVYYAPGTIQPTCAKIESGEPVFTGEAATGSDDYRLADHPVFCFDLPHAEEWTVTSLRAACKSYYSETMQCYAYDFVHRDWREFKSGAAWGSDMTACCVQDGRVFVMFELLGAGESYYSIFAPTLEAEGKVK